MNIMQGTNYDFNVFESQYKNYIIYETAKQGERKDLKQDKNVMKNRTTKIINIDS